MNTVRFLLVPVALCLSALLPTAAAQAMTAAHVERTHPGQRVQSGTKYQL